MTAPVRLQLSRTKRFKIQLISRAVNGLPAVSVARGHNRKWGNPFAIGMARCSGRGQAYLEERVTDNETAVRFFRDMLSWPVRPYPSEAEIVAELRGKNLARWCKPGEPCHADVLLELANRPVCEEETS